MHLDEILYIAKEIGKPLNESVKSRILTDLFKSFQYSNLTLKAEPIISKTSYGNKAKTLIWISLEYENNFLLNNATPEMFNTPEGRRKFINVNYVLNKKNEVYNAKNNDFAYINTSIILKITDLLHIYGYNIGISEITDNQLTKIPKDLAKKKLFKTGLLFWKTLDDLLRAISIDNNIICYIKELPNYDSWYDVNPDYTTDVDIEQLKQSPSALHDFLINAYVKIPTYNILTLSKDIKEELGTTSVKGLLSLYEIDYVYVLNEDGMKENNITEKLKTRNDYKEYLKSLYNLASKNIERYKNIIKYNKLLNTDSLIILNINNFMDILLNTVETLHDYEFDILLNNTINKFLGGLIKINNSFNLRDELRKYFYIYDYSTKNSKLYSTDDIYINLNNIGDIFIYLNTYINVYINICNDIIYRYNIIKDIKNNQNVDKKDLIQNINYLKNKYNTLIYTLKIYMLKEINRIINYNNITYIDYKKLETIIDPIYNYKFKEVN